MNDLISRQALYDKCVELEQEALKIVQTADDKIEKLIWNAVLTERSSFKFSVVDASPFLSNLSAESEPKWIPVNEKLPEDNQKVLVTIIRSDGTKSVWAGRYSSSNEYFWIENNEYFWIDNGNYCNYWKSKEILAWMPLPEPYEVRNE